MSTCLHAFMSCQPAGCLPHALRSCQPAGCFLGVKVWRLLAVACSKSEQWSKCLLPVITPSRYFAEACATLACMVVGVRDGACPRTGSPLRDYWITDGLYGSMNSLLYDHATVAPRPLRVATLPDGQPLLRGLSDEQAQHRPLDAREMTETLQGKVFGPTCDGLDTVLHEYGLPRLEVGDWLVFANHGAYTFVGACPFNGMDPTPATFYVYSDK